MKIGNSWIVMFLVVLLFFNGCSEDEVAIPDPNEYFILNNGYFQYQYNVTISTFVRPGDIVTKEAVKLNAMSRYGLGDKFSDLERSGEKLYGVRFYSDTLDIIDEASMSVERSVSYANHAEIGYQGKHLAVTKNKAFVSAWSYPNNIMDGSYESYLKVLNLNNLNRVDSIPVITDAQIWALATVDDKLFVSAGSYWTGYFIFVFDATTYKPLGKIDLNSFCSTILVDKDNDLLAFTGGGDFIRISSADLSILKQKAIWGASINYENETTTCSSGYALDDKENIVYFLCYAPQPASAPYILSSYNLVTDSIKMVDNFFVGPSTIAFDEKERLLLMATGNYNTTTNQSSGKIVKYTTAGVKSGEIDTPNLPTKILIKQ